ncbi:MULTISPECIES: helix-turn-helix domain-containing protein [Caproicibacterium]|uniref:AraC family transcriptional regulator n=1 Tax=Caproicibacterium argilliputei TaxID=3030016 RepID=A0AA97D8T1_9FIRM|nr:AraC family transcriptional regulator [Caproicibacterium argilliputei]WOC32660.1 AraC family transcriptional regulator [Caproicibacterium argilliputei]
MNEKQPSPAPPQAECRFLGSTQGTIANQMPLFCLSRDTFSLYCVQAACCMEDHRRSWQIPGGCFLVVRAGQAPLLKATVQAVPVLQIVGSGTLPLLGDTGPAVRIPEQNSTLAAQCAALTGQCTGGADCLLTRLCQQLLTETQPLSPADALPPASIRALKQILDTRYREKLTLDALAKELHWNKYKLDKDFKLYYGSSPFAYLLNVRVEEACCLLRNTNRSVLEIGAAVGIENPSYFIRLFKKRVGLSPLAYRIHVAESPETAAKKDAKA